jgi:uncharacterized protein
MWFEPVGLSLVFFFMFLGLIGAFVPFMPGPLLVWLAALVYAVATRFAVVGPAAFGFMTLIAIFAATADFWMSMLGAKTLGASGRSILWGIVGALIGFLILNLLGAIIGYALGILYYEYRLHGDWHAAFRASVGGLAGWGLATAVEVVGSLLIIVIFVWQIFTH